MTNPRDELIEAKVIREEDFALEAWRARVPFPEMRRRALVELGYAISESGLRALVKSARARVGDLSMTRDERIERQQAEIDERAARARFDLRKWHALAQEPQPDRDEYADTAEHRDALAAWAKRVEVANKAIDAADRRLAAAQFDLFGPLEFRHPPLSEKCGKVSRIGTYRTRGHDDGTGSLPGARIG